MATALPWATFLGTAASIGLVLGAVALLASGILNLVDKAQPKLRRGLFIGGSCTFFFAFASLVALFINHQFQFEYVFKHSQFDLEFQYLIAGVWSGQEGSFLLWGVTSALFGILVIRSLGNYERWFTTVYGFFLAALAGILSFESPFARFPGGAFPPGDGNGMPPSLLNYWVVIHPPTIFLGFGSLTVLFAWAVAAMLHRDLDNWIPRVRSWALVSLTFLGVGLCMGGFWAYETLGWGGFWMWDPVENTSFVPWVAVAGFVHGMFVQQAKGKWKHLNAVLAGLPFVLFCYGTFLTRSGFLGDTSVHSFAQMDHTAMWLLAGIGGISIALLTGTTIWSTKKDPAPKVDTAKPPFLLNRENFYGVGVWLLVFFGLVVGVGMSVPFLAGIMGQQQKTVEEHLYHQILAWPFIPIVLGLALAPFVTWSGIPFKNLAGKLINTFAVSIGITGFVLLWVKWAGSEVPIMNWLVGIPGVAADPNKTVSFSPTVQVNATLWVVFLTWLCLFAILANLNRVVDMVRRQRKSIGGVLTHVGLMVTLLGLVFSRGFEQKAEINVHPTIPEAKRTAFGYLVSYDGHTKDYTDRHNKIKFTVSDGKSTTTVTPGLYFVRGADGLPQPMKVPYILSKPLYDLYFTVHEFSFNGSEPTSLSQGETARFNNIFITNNGLRTTGPGGGLAGTTFIADLTVDTPEGTKTVSPYFRLTEQRGQFDNPPVPIDKDLEIVLDHIDAATKDVFLVVNYRSEMFPVDVLYKPLTGFVWYGVGIMCLGGTMAAFSRRYRPKTDSDNNDSATGESEPESESQDHASEHLAQV